MSHDAGHGRVEATGLHSMAGGMGFEVAGISCFVNWGQPRVVAQPQTVASLVDMQGDEAVHRMPVMMIVHEMRKYALVLITFHCKLKEKTCLNLSRNWLQPIWWGKKNAEICCKIGKLCYFWVVLIVVSIMLDYFERWKLFSGVNFYLKMVYMHLIKLHSIHFCFCLN